MEPLIVDKKRELLGILIKSDVKKSDVQKMFVDLLDITKIANFGIEDIDISNLQVVKEVIASYDTLCKKQFIILENETVKDLISSFLESICDFNSISYSNLIINAVNTGLYLSSNNIDISIFYRAQNVLNTTIIRVLKDKLTGETFDVVSSLIKFSNFISGIVALAYYEKLILQETNRVHQEALIDPLSKLYNRLKFEELKTREFSRVKRYKTPLSVCMMDIDNFKKINDSYGHLVGDEVIKNAGNILINNTRKSDFCIRWGGEEFLIIFTHTSVDKAFIACEKIRKAIESFNSLRFTASFGLSEVLETDFSLEDTIDRADKALYLAKAKGKNRTEVYKENPNFQFKFSFKTNNHLNS